MSIPYYNKFLSPQLISHLIAESDPVEGIPELYVAQHLLESFPNIENSDALQFVCELYDQMKPKLAQVLAQRTIDRAFLDKRTLHFVGLNEGIDFQSAEYHTVIGERDNSGRVVVGPLTSKTLSRTVRVPEFLKGNQVTLFGPPDTAKMSINAMNSLHHRLLNEDPFITELVDESGDVPRWGADNEDSKTPIMRNFLHACQNLMGCFDESLSFYDDKKKKHYTLKDGQLARPIKRIPGLALPDGNHIFNGEPLPLHLYDFAMHLYHNWFNSKALMFYIPKLENEEEAEYVHSMIRTAELMIQKLHPEYQVGSVGVFIVFENPRAIFRISEIAESLYPYFVGGSLGWHDFLASAARLFKHDSNYRIPVKADPNIVINHIKESHLILTKSLKPIQGISIGGMYGTLYEEGNPLSFELSIIGYIKDVVAQMKRGLDGFWVAHPNFVRVGIALVAAWRRYEANPSDDSLERLVKILVPNLEEQTPLLEFVFGEDVDGLEADDPLYLRSVLAADIVTSDLIANDDEDEIRYNIFQALQYLADWLCGNGCVALPAQLTTAKGEKVFVRIMDDLATTERSRWELWAEVYHGRVAKEEFERLLQDEAEFIKRDIDTDDKRIQVRWRGEAARWYPTAIDILRQLVMDPDPVEFVPELLLPFTFDSIRNAEDPFELVKQLHPRYH